MARQMDRAQFALKTGKSFADWMSWLDAMGGRQLDHKTLARAVEATGAATAWWAQGIVVAYEQEIGRRAPGETTGGFRVSITRQMPGPAEDVMGALEGRLGSMTTLAGAAPSGPVRRSATEKRLFYRVKLGSEDFEAAVVRKEASACQVTLTHAGLADADRRESVRQYWLDFLRGP